MENFNTSELLEKLQSEAKQSFSEAPKPDDQDSSQGLNIDADDFDDLDDEQLEETRSYRKTSFDEGQTYNKKPKIYYQKQAKMFRSSLEMFTKTVASLVSGKSRDLHSWEESEKEDYEEVCATYFEITDKGVNPVVQFWGVTLTMVGGSIYAAYEMGKEEKRKKAKFDARKATATATDPFEKAAAQEAYQEIVKEEKEKGVDKPLRNRFEIDSNGFYNYGLDKKYIKGEKTDMPGKVLLDMINNLRDGGASWKVVNEQVRLHLYGSKKPV